jgi:peptidoglycan/xylan/chitin deacetylase (PgdA/CDA1 family)
VVREAGLAGVVMWSRSAHDYRAEPAARVTARLARARGGDILLLHDGDPARDGADRSNTVAALGELLPRWKAAGLRMVTPDEIGL